MNPLLLQSGKHQDFCLAHENSPNETTGQPGPGAVPFQGSSPQAGSWGADAGAASTLGGA